jgi:hypothetical protein
MDLPFIKLQKEIIKRQKDEAEQQQFLKIAAENGLYYAVEDIDSSDLVEKTWIESLLKKYPDCPNPINYPDSALHYLLNHKKTLG